MRTDGSIDGFAALLGQTGLDLDAEEMADALWLAGHISPGVSEQNIEEEVIEKQFAEPTVREKYLDSELEEDEDDAQLPLSLPPKQDSGAAKPNGIPIKVPAAPALRIRLELARALRPLRRHVPSPVRMEFDQAATIECIADQGIWLPILSPAPERWLEVALVIEESKSAPLWKETLAEFQTLLERQGAFRTVSSWRLRSSETGELTLLSGNSNRPRSARELMAPAGRRLILVVSDCTSTAWQRGTIYPWLKTWGEQAPMTVIQLLPERLWAQTGLAHGTPMWLNALEPGVPNARMMATAQMPLWDLFGTEQEQVTVPVVSLETEPLKQWASVVTGDGEIRTVGFRFEKREPTLSEIEGKDQPELSAEEKVQLFRATASLTAQKLAGLMSAAPVSPPIINLIRQTMLPEAASVHVAEVYMGGLIETCSSGEYDFPSEVRNILLDTVSITDTEKVLDKVSGYIGARIGLNTQSFEALLQLDFSDDADLRDIMIPFARVALQTLKRMGREYSKFTNQMKFIEPTAASQAATKHENGSIPLLQTFIFREANILTNQSIAQVTQTIYPEQPGRVYFQATYWPARIQNNNSDSNIALEGDKVIVRGRQGLTLLVEPLGDHNIEHFVPSQERDTIANINLSEFTKKKSSKDSSDSLPEGKVLLFVESVAVVRNPIIRILEKGFPNIRVYTCNTADSVLDNIKIYQPDLLLTEISLLPCTEEELLGYSLRLISVKNLDSIPDRGEREIILIKTDEFYHVRIFDRFGTLFFDSTQDKFIPDKELAQEIDKYITRHQQINNKIRRRFIKIMIRSNLKDFLEQGSFRRPEVGLGLLKRVFADHRTLNITILSTYTKILIRIIDEIENHTGGFTVADKSIPSKDILTRIHWSLKGITHTKGIQNRQKQEYHLKPEHLQILKLAFQEGLQDKAIAEAMSISVRTVRLHFSQLQDVLELHPEELDGKNLRIVTGIKAREMGFIQ